MKFKDLAECKHFERDCLEDVETYIPTSHIECSWGGSDFQVYSVTLRGGKAKGCDDVFVYAVDDEDGGSGSYVAFDNDDNIAFQILGVIEVI